MQKVYQGQDRMPESRSGIVLGLAAMVILWIVFARSPFSYQIETVGLETVGQNPIAARYAGISVKRTILLLIALAGRLGDLAGKSTPLAALGVSYQQKGQSDGL